jgi:hypothetical protein
MRRCQQNPHVGAGVFARVRVARSKVARRDFNSVIPSEARNPYSRCER